MKGIGSFVLRGEMDEGMKSRNEWKEGKCRAERPEGKERRDKQKHERAELSIGVVINVRYRIQHREVVEEMTTRQ